MRKDSKEYLRALAAEVGDLIPTDGAKSLAKKLDFAISQAWKESQDEKGRVERRLAEIERLDEEAVEKRAIEIGSQLASDMKKKVDEYYANTEVEKAELRKEVDALLQWSRDNIRTIEGTRKAIEIMFFGDVEQLEGIRAAILGLWEFIYREPERRRDDIVSGDYHIIVLDERLPDDTWRFYIAVFDHEQYAHHKRVSRMLRAEELSIKGPANFRRFIRS